MYIGAESSDYCCTYCVGESWNMYSRPLKESNTGLRCFKEEKKRGTLQDSVPSFSREAEEKTLNGQV